MTITDLPTAPPACAAISRALREPLRGTAATAAGWLLVEHSGPWGDGALDRADERWGALVEERFEEAGARVLLVREPGRARPGGRRRVHLVHSGRGGPWHEELRVDDLSALLDLDPAVVASASAPGLGTPVTRPWFLVCTHGRKDACCAVLGRPVARALASTGRVWETTHLGGDRFAAAVVVLPHGYYLGHVDPADAGALAADTDRGLLSLRHLRGRCCDPPELQIAEHVVRERHGLRGIDDVVPLPGGDPCGDGVVVDRPGGRDRVRLSPAPLPERLTSCSAGERGRPDPRSATVTAVAR